ncbi:hypothetical protein [Vibrio campbellii]|nr:hypothetical protein [Vibrio campbellii]
MFLIEMAIYQPQHCIFHVIVDVSNIVIAESLFHVTVDVSQG